MEGEGHPVYGKRGRTQSIDVMGKSSIFMPKKGSWNRARRK